MPTSMISDNGWPVSEDPHDLGAVPFTVGGVDFGLVRGGKVYDLLHYVATQVHLRVEKADASKGCYAYNFRPNVNNPDVWSNHASATAIDYNSEAHPNGVSTGATWTAAQEAEIHKILEEVNGAVRWGGDYHSTPDAMHFEINVAPTGIDATAISDGAGASAPGGAPLDKAPTIAPTQWSVPTISFDQYPLDDHLGLLYPAWWKFVPDQDGIISIDMIESISAYNYTSNYSLLSIYTGPADAINSAQLTLVGSSSGNNAPVTMPQTYLQVTAGTTYYLCASCQRSDIPMAYVMKLSDWGYDSGYIQAEDQQAVVNYLGDTNPNDGYDQTTFNIEANPYFHRGNWGGGGSAVWQTICTNGPGFGGTFGLNHALGGEYPGLDNSASDCAWKHARLYEGSGFNWWSTDNGPGWNGTDPYNPGVPGFGNCPILYTGRQSGGSSPQAVGVVTTSTGIDVGIGGGYQDLDITVWGCGQTVNIRRIEENIGQSVGHPEITNEAVAAATADGWASPTVVWMPDPDTALPMRASLNKIELCPDEGDNGGPYATGEYGVTTVIWHVMPSRVDDGVSQSWGPFQFSFEYDPYYLSYGEYVIRGATPIWLGGQGGPDFSHVLYPPEVFAAYSGGHSEDMWYDIGDLDWWREREAEINAVGSADKYYTPESWIPGIQLFGLDLGHLSNSYPHPKPAEIATSYRTYRDKQVVAVRITGTPVPFKVIANPKIVDVDPSLIFSYLTGGLDNVRRAFCMRADFL